MSNSKPSSDCRNRTHALLSIRPRFVASILRGEKRYEFRRSVFSREVDVVVIYATAPIQRVVAEFDVVSVMTAPLAVIWSRTRKYAGVDKATFYAYFNGLDHANAIAIGEVRVYDPPFSLSDKLDVRPPQSFVYLESRIRDVTAVPMCGSPGSDHRGTRTNCLDWLSSLLGLRQEPLAIPEVPSG